MNDTEQMRRWRQAVRVGTRPTAGRGDCPPPDRLALLVGDPDAAPPELLAHVERCSACSEELRAVSDCDALDDLVEELAPRRRRFGPPVAWAAAASVLLAVALAVVVHQPAPDDLTRSAVVEGLAPPDRSTLAEPPAGFEWPSEAAAGRYEVVLFDALADAIWTSPTVSASRVELPGAVARSLSPGTYFWQVRHLDTGTVQGPFRFELTEPGNGR